ncbi:MAG: hypothetical protein K0U52_05470 [Gammaproteobacteria bacterium]|nr:hypothetical protein [Gammaproteobacteria bacterium]
MGTLEKLRLKYPDESFCGPVLPSKDTIHLCKFAGGVEGRKLSWIDESGVTRKIPKMPRDTFPYGTKSMKYTADELFRFSRNPNLPLTFVESNINEEWWWGEGGLSASLCITGEFIEKYPSKGWFWRINGLSSNPSITPEFVEKRIDGNWCWGRLGLSSNPSMTPEFVEKHMEKDWFWGVEGLSSNPSITPEFVERHMDKGWFWGGDGLSSNPSVTLEFVEKHLGKAWDWGADGLSSNPVVTAEFIERHEWYTEIGSKVAYHRFDILHWFPCVLESERRNRRIWSWDAVSMNPNVSFKFLMDHTPKTSPWKSPLAPFSYICELLGDPDSSQVSEHVRADLSGNSFEHDKGLVKKRLAIQDCLLEVSNFPEEIAVLISDFC